MRLGGSITLSGTRHATAAVVLGLALTALAGCGDDTADEPGASGATSSPGGETSSPSESTSSPSARPDAPACDGIWAEGTKIPRGYDGCNGEEGFVEKDVLSCSSGQFLARHDDHFYGVLGGKVHATESTVDEDDGYRDAVARCRG